MLGSALLVIILHSPVVYDGDTLSGTIENIPEVFGKDISVRLSGIDTAELHSRCDTEAILAKRAKARLQELIGNATEVELHNVARDKYFRLDAEVFANGVSVNSTLLQEGLAKPYFGGTKSSWCK